jgi:hypothetical protein
VRVGGHQLSDQYQIMSDSEKNPVIVDIVKFVDSLEKLIFARGTKMSTFAGVCAPCSGIWRLDGSAKARE